MRGARSLLLLAIVLVAGFVFVKYLSQKRVIRASAPKAPESLSPTLSSAAEDWQWSKTEGGRTVVDIRAKNIRQLKDASRFELENVRLRIFHKEGDEFDLVVSERAEFRQAEGQLYSDGPVEITLGVPAAGAVPHRLISIRSSGVTFDSKTGRASTDRPASFRFANGDGASVGASYDPTARELRMLAAVVLNYHNPNPKRKPMKVESGQLLYREPVSTIWLSPRARLTREGSVVEGADTVVTLENGVVRRVEAKDGKGTTNDPRRAIEYAADRLQVVFSEEGEVETVTGESNARLVSRSDSAETTVTSRRVDLAFDGANALTAVHAQGDSVVESKPRGAQPLPPTRILTSDAVRLKMRDGGKEIETAETDAPGRVEFLPNRPEQHRREMRGDRLWIAYGAKNRIQSFRSTNPVTRTYPLVKGPETVTSSASLEATFDAAGQVQAMEQRGNFQYQEGARKARAARGVLDQPSNRITLDTAARMWDETGSTAADTIVLDQKTGNFEARGHVTSSRVPDKPKDPGKPVSAGLLEGDEPVQATADRMTSESRNTLLRYLGHAVLWQGSNRVKADEVELDRKARRLTAHRDVVTQLAEEPRDGKKTQKTFTTVRAADLVYTEADRLAHYTGGTLLNSGGTQVKASEVRAYLAAPGAPSRLEKAYADGAVVVDQTTPGRTRQGTGDHAEYYVSEEKVILRGGQPQLIDSLRGRTRGAELTWFSADDKLLVDGRPEQRATSRLIRRK